jgi:deoxycytidylate deaminase
MAKKSISLPKGFLKSMNNDVLARAKIFIAAPREMSVTRFKQIVKHYLPKGDIVLGISKEQFVVGFENQPQFAMLKQETIQSVVDLVEASSSPHKISLLPYSQNDLSQIVEQLTSNQRVLLVNGSWKYAFHNLPAYKILIDKNIPIKFISPFVDEDEAKQYEQDHTVSIERPKVASRLSQEEMFAIADEEAKRSYDYSYQIGVALGRENAGSYELVTTAFNRVIPYQTYALHHGNSREKHLSPPHDTNHYDTIHAEMDLVVRAVEQAIDISGTTLFINVLPCPNCARTLSQTSISEIVYKRDHSDGYAKEFLEACGKKVIQV